MSPAPMEKKGDAIAVAVLVIVLGRLRRIRARGVAAAPRSRLLRQACLIGRKSCECRTS
jgi:hypothetical protein